MAARVAALRSTYYVLVAGQPRPVEVEVWARNFERMDRRLRRFGLGKLLVSTVWLGLDHNHTDDGPPLLWETMIFYGGWGWGLYCERYSSVSSAQDGHDWAVLVGLCMAGRLWLRERALWVRSWWTVMKTMRKLKKERGQIVEV